MSTGAITRRATIKAIAAMGAGAGAALAEPALAEAGALAIKGVPVELRIAAVVPGTVRISVVPVVDGSPVEPAPSGTLADREWAVPAIRLRTLKGTKKARVAGLDIEIGGAPLSVRVTKGKRAVQTLVWDEQGLGFSKGAAPLLGLGQGGPGFDRRGAFDRMRSGQGGYELATHGARVPVQWLVGTEGWAMFIHQPVGAFDLTGAEGRFLPVVPGGASDLFISAADEPAELMRAYAELTGYPEMPPLWSLGYQQSHRTLGSPEEILAEAREFRARRLPCDTMIYLGTGFCPNGWNTDNGEFAWNPKAFPDPAGAIKALHDEGYKVVLHVVVEGKAMTGRVSDPCTAAPLPSGKQPDGSWPPDRQIAC